jgi:hypothetical protein
MAKGKSAQAAYRGPSAKIHTVTGGTTAKIPVMKPKHRGNQGKAR